MDFKAQAEAFADALLGFPKRRKRIGNKVTGRCPLPDHEDKSPSFSYHIEMDAYACSCSKGKGSELREKLGWVWSGNGHHDWKQSGGVLERMHYYGNNRKLRIRLPEHNEKRFTWEHLEAGKWVDRANGEETGLYLWEESKDAKTIVLVESETDVEALLDLGVAATCTSRGGSSDLKEVEIECLIGKRVILIPHHDERKKDWKPGNTNAGKEWEKRTLATLRARGVKRAVYDLKEPWKDVREWIENGNAGKAEIDAAIREAKAQIIKPPRRLADLKLAAEELLKTPRIPTGLHGLGDLFGGGYLPGWVVLVGAFTSGGKTAFLCQEALAKAYAGHPVLYLTLELAEIALAAKIFGAIGTHPDVIPEIYVEENYSKMTQIEECVENWVESVESKLTPIVLVDYLQRAQGSDDHNREREVASACEAIQKMTQRLKTVTIVGAQFNRDSQKEDEPQLHHFRESGLAEQIADLALLAWVPELNKWNIKVGKARWGGKVGDKLEMTADFGGLSFGPISELIRYQNLIDAVIEFFGDGDPVRLVRDVTSGVRYGKGHPLKKDLEAAGKASGRFEVRGSTVVLTARSG